MRQEPARAERFTLAQVREWEEPNGEVRTFLQAQYGGKCQICQTAPFPKRDGEPYFTAVYLVSRTRARWADRPGNALCLCPNCCARFVFGSREGDIAEQARAFRALNEGGSQTLGLRITLCGRPVTVRYSERHMIDLQALINVGSQPQPGP